MKEGDYSTELIAIEEGTADVIQDGKKIASLARATSSARWACWSAGRAMPTSSPPPRCALIKLTHWEIRRMSAGHRQPDQGDIEERRQAGVADPAHKDD